MLGLEIALLALVFSGVLLVGICGIAYSIFMR